MRTRLLVARCTAMALLGFATIAATAPTAVAEPAVAGAYTVTLAADPVSTDFDHRTVTLTGAVTRSDGTPVADGAVQLGESVLYETWNPWEDPIDPIERETRTVDNVRTDENGQFSLSDVLVDRWSEEPSRYLNPLNEVNFFANYDADPANDDPLGRDIFSAQLPVATTPVASTLTYKVDKKKVREGDTLTVTGNVSWPDGHGPVAGTRVFLRTYSQTPGQYNAQTTADAAGNFTVSSEVRDFDDEFVIFSAPSDYYISGVSHKLPVEKVG